MSEVRRREGASSMRSVPIGLRPTPQKSPTPMAGFWCSVAMRRGASSCCAGPSILAPADAAKRAAASRKALIKTGDKAGAQESSKRSSGRTPSTSRAEAEQLLKDL